MRIHIDDQERMYRECWKPMQDLLGDSLTEYIRHFLMKDGSIVKTTDIYEFLRTIVGKRDPLFYLEDLSRYANYYARLLNPDKEESPKLREYLKRLNRIEVTTAYPFLLNLYREYLTDKTLSEENFVELLKILENYLIRGFICNSSNKQLNKYFPSLYNLLKEDSSNDYVGGLKSILQARGYPKDAEFKDRLIEAKLYGAGDRRVKTQLILESLEQAFGHKEPVPLNALTIEHIMPQTLTEEWKRYLGHEWEVTHELDLHSLGNLTLTAYNAELSNFDYPKKKEFYLNSHIELNKYFKDILTWKKEDIEQRGKLLAESALTIWPYFGKESKESSNNTDDVTGKTPRMLRILGQSFPVKSWRDVLENTTNTIAELEPEMFLSLAVEFPKFIGKDANVFHSSRSVANGFFVETNLRAESIKRFCYQAIESISLTSDDWQVEFA